MTSAKVLPTDNETTQLQTPEPTGVRSQPLSSSKYLSVPKSKKIALNFHEAYKRAAMSDDALVSRDQVDHDLLKLLNQLTADGFPLIANEFERERDLLMQPANKLFKAIMMAGLFDRYSRLIDRAMAEREQKMIEQNREPRYGKDQGPKPLISKEEARKRRDLRDNIAYMDDEAAEKEAREKEAHKVPVFPTLTFPRSVKGSLISCADMRDLVKGTEVGDGNCFYSSVLTHLRRDGRLEEVFSQYESLKEDTTVLDANMLRRIGATWLLQNYRLFDGNIVEFIRTSIERDTTSGIGEYMNAIGFKSHNVANVNAFVAGYVDFVKHPFKHYADDIDIVALGMALDSIFCIYQGPDTDFTDGYTGGRWAGSSEPKYKYSLSLVAEHYTSLTPRMNASARGEAELEVKRRRNLLILQQQEQAAEAKRRADEAEAKRRADEAEAKRRAQMEAEANRRAQMEAEAKRRAAEAEAQVEANRRAQMEEERRRNLLILQQQEQAAEAKRRADEAEAKRREDEAAALRALQDARRVEQEARQEMRIRDEAERAEAPRPAMSEEEEAERLKMFQDELQAFEPPKHKRVMKPRDTRTWYQRMYEIKEWIDRVGGYGVPGQKPRAIQKTNRTPEERIEHEHNVHLNQWRTRWQRNSNEEGNDEIIFMMNKYEWFHAFLYSSLKPVKKTKDDFRTEAELSQEKLDRELAASLQAVENVHGSPGHASSSSEFGHIDTNEFEQSPESSSTEDQRMRLAVLMKELQDYEQPPGGADPKGSSSVAPDSSPKPAVK